MTYIIGLTGGIGSGKSTVSEYLRGFGAYVIDADAISRQMTAINGPAIPIIEKQFGPDYISIDGSMNRDKMRELVFSNLQAKNKLELIVHPLIQHYTQIAVEHAMSINTQFIVHDLPLLVESGHWRKQLHHVLVVDCEREIQIQRVIARNGFSRNAVELIIQQQAPREIRLACADSVINNSNLDLNQLETRVSQWWKMANNKLRFDPKIFCHNTQKSSIDAQEIML